MWWIREALSGSDVALPVVESSTPPLVGRGREITALGAAIDALKSGTGGFVTIEGPRGSGKHRLLDELRSASKSADVDWQTTAIFALDGVVRAQRHGFAAQRPRVFVVEHGELVTAREASVLHEVIGDARASQTLIILLVETGLESPLGRRVLAAVIQRAVVSLSLAPLNSDEMSTIFRTVCGRDFASIPRDIGAGCVELAGGNPGYLLDIVAALASENPSFPTAAEEVACRSHHLNRFERRVLRAASVAEDFTLRQLSAMLDATQPQTAHALQLLCDRGLLTCRERAERVSTYGFAHPLWRLVVYDNTTNDVRSLLHRAALRHLAGSDEQQAAAKAEHLARAGQSARAVREAIAATDFALRERNYVEAARWSRFVLRFARDVDSRLVARERLAVSLEMLGACESAVIEYSSGLHDAQREGKPGKVVQFAEGLAVTQFNRGRPAEALDSLARVLSGGHESVEAPPRLLALAAYFSALSASKPGPWLSQFEKSDLEQITPVDLLRIHASRVFAFLNGGDAASAVREADAGLVVGRSTDDVVARVKGYELAGEVAATLGDMHRAVSYSREAFAVLTSSPVDALSVSKVHQMDYLRLGAAANLAQYLTLSGNVAEARELCATFRQTPSLTGNLQWAMMRVSDTFSRVVAGAPSPITLEPPLSGTGLLDAAIALEQQTSISFAASALALQLYLSGEHEAARDVVHRGLASLAHCTDAWLLLTIAAQIAPPPDVRRVRQIASTGPLAHHPFYRAVALLTEGLYAKRQHRAASRVSSDLVEARSLFDQLGNKYLSVLCDACVGRAVGRGARSEALEVVDLLGTVRPHVDKPLLSEQQSRIVELVALGWSDRRVGAALGIAEGTVGVHLARIYRKLDVSSRAELRSRWLETKVLSVST